MAENASHNNINKNEYEKLGFGYVGKSLDMLLKQPNEAKIILVLKNGDTTFREIATLTGINDGTLNRNLQWLTNNKCITTYPLHKRNIYTLSETGKVLANAWAAFVNTLENLMPPEQAKAVKEIINKEKPIAVHSLIRNH